MKFILNSLFIFLIAFTSISVRYSEHSRNFYSTEAEIIENRVLEDRTTDDNNYKLITTYDDSKSLLSHKLKSSLIVNSFEYRTHLKEFLVRYSHSGLSPPVRV